MNVTGTNGLILGAATTSGAGTISSTPLPFSLLTSVCAGGSTSGSFTSSAINTTGATTLIASVSSQFNPTFSDSQSNTWVSAVSENANNTYNHIYYVSNPSTSSSHTFSITGSVAYASFCVQAFTGVLTTSPVDQISANHTTNGFSVSPGSVTPTKNYELLIASAGLANNNGTTSFTTPTGVTLLGHVNASANNDGAFLGYAIQTTPTAFNPSWASNGQTDQVAETATFYSGVPTGSLAFSPGGVQSVLMTTGGNVGIGSVNPGQALDVQGTIRANAYVAGTTSGVNCLGAPDSGFTVVNGIVTAC